MRTRAVILRAAAEVFNEFGYSGASIRRVIDRAGVTQGAMYFHFASKEALAREVINSQPDTVVPLVTSEGLQRVVDVTLAWACQLQKDALLQAGVRLAVEQGSFGLRDDTSYREWAGIFTECLRVARQRGELLEGAVPEEVADHLVGTCTGIQLQARLTSSWEDLPRRVVRMWRYLLPGIATSEAVLATRLHTRWRTTA